MNLKLSMFKTMHHPAYSLLTFGHVAILNEHFWREGFLLFLKQFLQQFNPQAVFPVFHRAGVAVCKTRCDGCDVIWADVRWCDVMRWNAMWCGCDAMWLCDVVGSEVMWCDAMWLCDVVNWEMCCELRRADVTAKRLRRPFRCAMWPAMQNPIKLRGAAVTAKPWDVHSTARRNPKTQNTMGIRSASPMQTIKALS